VRKGRSGFLPGECQAEPVDALTRREAAQKLGSGVLFLFTFRQSLADEEKAGPQKRPLLSSRLHIGDNGVITLLTGKVECGQGIRTSLTQVAAEELRLDPAQVRLLMGDTALVPNDGGTWGSLTTPQTVPVIRQACASLRELLCRYAAEKWGVKPAELRVANGQAVTPGGRTYTYRDLAGNGALAAAVSANVSVTDPSEWQICGKPMHSVQGVAIVTGGQQYSSDLTLPAMRHGRIVRPPNHKCKLLSFDASGAEAAPGVRIVHEGNLLGVTAPSAEAANAAAQLIRARWSEEPLGDPHALFRDLKAKAKPPERKEFNRYPAILEGGSVAEGMARSAHKLQESYGIAHIAHVPLEARTAIAHWQGDHLTVRCGTQAPFIVRDEIAQAFRIPAEQVRVIVSDTGSGYGAKHNSECEMEAARLARGVPDPVRLAWSREEEFTQSYCRPAAVMEVQSGVGADGVIAAWEFHNYNGGAASLTPPYQIPNHYIAYHASESPLRSGSYRSLAAVGNTFAREMHIDEIAAKLDLDPLELRLRNVENPRLKTVLQRAAERFGWGRSKSGHGIGYGLACNIEKGGHLALFTELEVEGKAVRLRRMVAAFDAGAVINPDILRNQVEGALVQGMGGALFEELRFNTKQIVNGKLSAYRVPRFVDVPSIEVILVDRRDIPSAGAGESPITVAAPAIGAALYAACGQRIRQLPLLPALGKAAIAES
jgi:nicotinate dehydrogenase subunit B